METKLRIDSWAIGGEGLVIDSTRDLVKVYWFDGNATSHVLDNQLISQSTRFTYLIRERR